MSQPDEQLITLNLSGTPYGIRIEIHPSGSTVVFLQQESGATFLGIQEGTTLIKELNAWAKMHYFSLAFGGKVVVWWFSALLALLFKDEDLIRYPFITSNIGYRLVGITYLNPLGLGYFLSGTIDYSVRQLVISRSRQGKPYVESVLFLDRKTLCDWRIRLNAISPNGRNDH